MGFPKDFKWGAASAAYQIEGAYNEDGKGLNIWDVFAKKPGVVAHGESGDVACDHYHRFLDDIALMKKIGIKYYRFSMSWARIIPDGVGEINEKGAEFYKVKKSYKRRSRKWDFQRILNGARQARRTRLRVRITRTARA